MLSPEVVETGSENDGDSMPELSATVSPPPSQLHVVNGLLSNSSHSSSPSISPPSAATQDGCVTSLSFTLACDEHVIQNSMIQNSMLHAEANAPSEQANTLSPDSFLKQLIEDRISEPIVAHIFSGKPARPDGFAKIKPCLQGLMQFKQ